MQPISKGTTRQSQYSSRPAKVCGKGTPSASLSLVKSFLTYAASADGQTAATEVGYAPLPDEVRTKVASTVASIS